MCEILGGKDLRIESDMLNSYIDFRDRRQSEITKQGRNPEAVAKLLQGEKVTDEDEKQDDVDALVKDRYDQMDM